MATKKQSQEQAKPESPFGVASYRTDNYRALYANICQVALSNSDIQILLGRGGQILGETKVEEVATVYLTPSQAKSLALVLSEQVQNFEKRSGVIAVEPTSNSDAEASGSASVKKK
jgi:hypothetical protein